MPVIDGAEVEGATGSDKELVHCSGLLIGTKLAAWAQRGASPMTRQLAHLTWRSYCTRKIAFVLAGGCTLLIRIVPPLC